MTKTAIMSVVTNPEAAKLAAKLDEKSLDAAIEAVRSKPAFGFKPDITLAELANVEGCMMGAGAGFSMSKADCKYEFKLTRKEMLEHHVTNPIELSLDAYRLLLDALSIACEIHDTKDHEVALGAIIEHYRVVNGR